jgi:hypothetical protein
MKTYVLTVFEKNGDKVLDETFMAANNEEAKITGTTLLEEKNYSDYTHRCVTTDGALILFHR